MRVWRAKTVAAALIALATAWNSAASAQTAITPFADLNTGPNPQPQGSLGVAAVDFDGRVFFVATTAEFGSELWVTDGTALNTRLFADICPGRCSSVPASFYVEGNDLFFSADDGRLGVELWRYNAGAIAPVLVADINPGAKSSSPAQFARLTIRINTTVVTRTYFVATRQGEGREIWRLSTGASPSASLERDVAPGSASADPRSFVTLNTLQVGFTAQTPAVGRELYALDYTSTTGPASGAGVQSGLLTSTQRVVVGDLVSLGPNVYAVVRIISTADDELWVTQGTVASTIKLRTVDSISNLSANTALFRLFFTSRVATATSLAITDGTVAGTSNFGSSTLDPRNLASVGNRLLFTGINGTNGRELFGSDGTTAGTALVKELVSGTGGVSTSAIGVRSANGTRLLLGFSDQLWISDGTTAGTTEISGSAIQGTGVITVVAPTRNNEAMIGFAAGSASSGEPFYTAGTSASTLALGNLQSDIGDSFPFPIAEFNSRLIFSAAVSGQSALDFSLPSNGPGAIEALPIITDVASGTHFGKLWFRGLTSLVMTDGTVAGTSELMQVSPEIRGPECVIERNGAAYFIAAGASANDVEVYRSDGTTANTVPVTDLSSSTVFAVDDSCFQNFHRFAGFGDKLFFLGFDNATGLEPHVLDGNDNQSLVADVRAGSVTSDVRDMIGLADRLVFVADDGVFGRELWVTQGTAQSTQRISDINPGAGSSELFNLTRIGNRIVFTAFEPVRGTELYVTDGTAAGTLRITDLFAGAGSAFGDYAPIFAHLGGKAYFRATSSTDTACSLFETDGTAAGTRCAYDSASLALGPAQEAVVTDNGAVAFGAKRLGSADGEELRLVFNRQFASIAGNDVAAGPAGSAPQNLRAAGNSVYFQANDGITGRELWRLTVGNLDTVFANGFE